MFATIKDAVASIWENTFCRFSIILGCIGFVPFYFLSMAMATIR